MLIKSSHSNYLMAGFTPFRKMFQLLSSTESRISVTKGTTLIKHISMISSNKSSINDTWSHNNMMIVMNPIYKHPSKPVYPPVESETKEIDYALAKNSEKIHNLLAGLNTTHYKRHGKPFILPNIINFIIFSHQYKIPNGCESEYLIIEPNKNFRMNSNSLETNNEDQNNNDSPFITFDDVDSSELFNWISNF